MTRYAIRPVDLSAEGLESSEVEIVTDEGAEPGAIRTVARGYLAADLAADPSGDVTCGVRFIGMGIDNGKAAA